MLDEGAGDLDAAAYQEKMEELALRMSYDDTRDAFYGSFETLTGNRDETRGTVEARASPSRVLTPTPSTASAASCIANLVYADRDPEKTAFKEWFATAFAGHRYGRPSDGTEATLTAITAQGSRRLSKSQVFARSNLKVVVVGDINAAELGKMLDDVFGSLPAKAKLDPLRCRHRSRPARNSWSK